MAIKGGWDLSWVTFAWPNYTFHCDCQMFEEVCLYLELVVAMQDILWWMFLSRLVLRLWVKPFVMGGIMNGSLYVDSCSGAWNSS